MNTQISKLISPTQWGGGVVRPGYKKAFTAPKWARFRMFIQYDHGNAKYPSWDYTYCFTNGIKTKRKSEAIGLDKLIEEQHRQLKKGKVYRYINIFANLTNNLDTVTGNFDYLVCTIVAGNITWKNPLYWKPEAPEMLDIQKMVQYMKDKKSN